jgi:hypothetical protein
MTSRHLPKAAVRIIFMMGVIVNPPIVSANSILSIRVEELRRNGNLSLVGEKDECLPLRA